jgi:DNA polymerase (family 10)
MVTFLSGARFTISTDVHHPKHLLNMRYGVTRARRAWLGPEDILNTRHAEEFARAIKPFRA